MSTLEIVFKRQKTSAEGHSQTLTQSNPVFINPGIYLHSMATAIGKSAEKQFPAYVGDFWSMSQRLLWPVTAFALEIVFKRQKTSAEGHSQTRTQSDPGIYLHSMATVIGKSAEKQFPAYVGDFWSMSQRLLEIYS